MSLINYVYRQDPLNVRTVEGAGCVVYAPTSLCPSAKLMSIPFKTNIATVANIIVASMLLSTMNYFHLFERTQFAITGDLSGGSRIKWKSLLESQDFEKLSTVFMFL